MSPVVVSFYTADTPYEQEAREMEQSARAFGLFTDVRAVPNLGDWESNCGMKPAFIRDRMRDYPDRAVVWLDADARVVKPPDLFRQLTCDFAAHWRYGSELLSGTLFFGATGTAKGLVNAWCDAQAKTPTVWDQKTLARVIDAGFAARIERLPSEYTRVFDDPKMGDAVILHTQASRRCKQCVALT